MQVAVRRIRQPYTPRRDMTRDPQVPPRLFKRLALRELDELAWAKLRQCGEELGIEGSDRFDRVGFGEENDHRDGKRTEILFVLQAAIVGDQGIEPSASGKPKQLAVFDSRPVHERRGETLVPG